MMVRSVKHIESHTDSITYLTQYPRYLYNENNRVLILFRVKKPTVLSSHYTQNSCTREGGGVGGGDTGGDPPGSIIQVHIILYFSGINNRKIENR